MTRTRSIITSVHKTRIGDMLFAVLDDALCVMDFAYRRMRATIDKRIQQYAGAPMLDGNHNRIDEAIAQLEAYLEGNRREFSVPLLCLGSPFQIKVWSQLQKIPYGQTVSYRDIAQAINQPSAVRAVAAANGANAISIMIPCHRVIGSDGSLTGYGGGLPMKKKLLRLEGLSFDDHQQQPLNFSSQRV